MNKQVKELAREAGILRRTHSFGRYWEGELTEEQKKFAELIIRECANIGFNTAYPNKGVEVAQAIKEHFGVE